MAFKSLFGRCLTIVYSLLTTFQSLLNYAAFGDMIKQRLNTDRTVSIQWLNSDSETIVFGRHALAVFPNIRKRKLCWAMHVAKLIPIPSYGLYFGWLTSGLRWYGISLPSTFMTSIMVDGRLLPKSSDDHFLAILLRGLAWARILVVLHSAAPTRFFSGEYASMGNAPGKSCVPWPDNALVTLLAGIRCMLRSSAAIHIIVQARLAVLYVMEYYMLVPLFFSPDRPRNYIYRNEHTLWQLVGQIHLCWNQMASALQMSPLHAAFGSRISPLFIFSQGYSLSSCHEGSHFRSSEFL